MQIPRPPLLRFPTTLNEFTGRTNLRSDPVLGEGPFWCIGLPLFALFSVFSGQMPFSGS
jgi:hypothetical protein